jgi:hypothetical protein
MQSDKEALAGLSKKFDQIESALEDQKADTEKALKIPGMIARGELATAGVAIVQNEALEVDVEDELTSWPSYVRTKFEKFKKAPRIWDSDPGKTIFQEAENVKDGLILEGMIEEELPDVLVIRLNVHPMPDGILSGVVTFLLHPTLAIPIRHVMSADNCAEIKFGT